MRLKRIACILIAILMAFIVFGCGSQSQPAPDPQNGGANEQTEVIKLKAAHICAPSFNYQTSMIKLAEMVKERTNGKVEIEVYHSGQLGNERELIEAMQVGSVDIAVTSAAPLSNFFPEFKIFDMPYLIRDSEHAAAVCDGPVGTEFLEKLKTKGLVGLGWWDTGFRQIMTKEPVKSLADAKSLKIRVMESPMFMSMFTAFGTIPTPMAYGELYTSLQQGTIDGIDVNIMAYYTSGFHQVAPYVAYTKHTFGSAPLMMSKKVFDGLPADVQNIILEVAKECTEHNRQERDRIESESRIAAEKEGVIFYEIDTSEWAKATESLYEKFANELPMDVVERIKNT